MFTKNNRVAYRSVFRNHKLILSSFMTLSPDFYKSKMTGATSEAGIYNPSRVPEFTSVIIV